MSSLHPYLHVVRYSCLDRAHHDATLSALGYLWTAGPVTRAEVMVECCLMLSDLYRKVS